MRAPDKSHSRLTFAHSTRAISANGCARMGRIALSPAFRTLDAHDLRRESRVKSPKRAFRTRLPQKFTRQNLQNERFIRDFLQKSSGNTHRSTRQSQCDNDIHLRHNSQPHDSLRLPRIFPRPHVYCAQNTAPATKCHLRHTSQPYDSLRRPRKSHFHASNPAQNPAPATKSANIISREFQPT